MEYESAMNKTIQPLLLSLKPRYADLIFAGRKKAELRRRIASGIEGRDAFIYVSSPVKQLRGGFRILLARDIPGTIDCFCDLDVCYIFGFGTYDDVDVPV